jgi:tRNA-dihydrouridine synthase
MRLVHERDDEATLCFARGMERAGAAALTLHGRTAEQYYRGEARKDVVGLLAGQLAIPVIASGDVFSAEDIEAYWGLGACAVMVARGARGNPWMFAGYEPELEELVAVAREHTVRLYDWQPRKLVWLRKHLAWYFKGTPCALRVRKAVQSAVSLEDYLSILDSCV